MQESTAVNSAAHELVHAMMQLMTGIAKALVDHPDSVSVQAALEGEATILKLRVAPDDLGKVIGKQGRTARSIRTILGAASMKAHHRFALDIQEVGGSVPMRVD